MHGDLPIPSLADAVQYDVAETRQRHSLGDGLAAGHQAGQKRRYLRVEIIATFAHHQLRRGGAGIILDLEVMDVAGQHQSQRRLVGIGQGGEQCGIGAFHGLAAAAALVGFGDAAEGMVGHQPIGLGGHDRGDVARQRLGRRGIHC